VCYNVRYHLLEVVDCAFHLRAVGNVVFDLVDLVSVTELAGELMYPLDKRRHGYAARVGRRISAISGVSYKGLKVGW
jgi:hypothetical protein